MPSYPPVQSVIRTFGLLHELNRNRVSTVGGLHKATKLPKPTVVRLLETLIAAGYVSTDVRTGGYQITSAVQTLSSGFHGSPLVVEAARPWCIDLTRRIKWPISIAVLDVDAVAVRFSTIPDSPVSPFHATLNMRLSLVSRALGRAYLAFCEDEERAILVRLLGASSNPEDRASDIAETVGTLTRRIRQHGFAERDPTMEPRNSSTIAVPICQGPRVLATLGLTYFRSAITRTHLRDVLLPSLKLAADNIQISMAALLKLRADADA